MKIHYDLLRKLISEQSLKVKKYQSEYKNLFDYVSQMSSKK